jgi:hypothetical protein
VLRSVYCSRIDREAILEVAQKDMQIIQKIKPLREGEEENGI